jgi:LPS-assembly protein
MRAFVAFLLLSLGWASAGLAQSAGAPPGDAIAKPAKGAKGAAKAPKDPAQPDAPPEGEIRIRADTQKAEKDHLELRGFVDLQAGDTRIQSDRLDLFQTEVTGGATKRRIVAEGNVVFLRGDERLSGEKLEMDLDASTGLFTNAVGYMSPGVFVEAKSVARLDAHTYKITDGTFTSCAQPTPRWSFTAGGATLHIDDKITAKNVLFRVKDVPAFYLPYFVYPIKKDQRATGFLFPHFGYSSFRGINVGSGFFWAMGRSYDQTFYADSFSKFGYGIGHEFRYLLDSPSRGSMRTYFFWNKASKTWDHELDWNVNQQFDKDTRLTVQVREYSNTQFQQQIQENFDLLTLRTRYATASVQRTFGRTTAQLFADSTDTFFGEQRRVNRHVPTLRVNASPQKIKHTGIVFGYEARGEGLSFGTPGDLRSYERFDLYPRVSRPVSVSFLQLTPQVQARYTRWNASQDPTTLAFTDAVGIDRRYAEASMELRGPTFSRVINTPGNFYSERFKHVIGPEATWTYRSHVDRFNEIPKFDGNDYVLGTNEVNYALVNRLYAKRTSRAGGKPEAYEFFNWRVSQTYYVNIKDQQSEFDPNYSSVFFGPGGVPTHVSPVQSRMRLRPTPAFTTNFDLEYDVKFRQMRSMGLNTSLERDHYGIQAGWWRGRNVAGLTQNRALTRDTLRGSARLDVLPGRMRLEGSADYDILQKNMVQSTARVRYSVQCCGFTVEAIQSDYNIRQDRQFRFSIELANIGSVGSFNGADAGDRRNLSTGGLP